MNLTIREEAEQILKAQELKGWVKYGQTLDHADCTDQQLIQHALEEAADLMHYLIALRRKLQEKEATA